MCKSCHVAAGAVKTVLRDISPIYSTISLTLECISIIFFKMGNSLLNNTAYLYARQYYNCYTESNVQLLGNYVRTADDNWDCLWNEVYSKLNALKNTNKDAMVYCYEAMLVTVQSLV